MIRQCLHPRLPYTRGRISIGQAVMAGNVSTKRPTAGVEELPKKISRVSSSTICTEEQKGDVVKWQRSTKPSATVKSKPVEHNICDASVRPDNNTRLQLPFYDKPCVDLAKALLGKRIVRVLDSEKLCGRIVETESYLGGDDKASHSYGSRQTAKNGAMFMPAGTAYVYNIYGIYTCLNISSKGDGAAVLIRAIDDLQGIKTMRTLRGVRRSDKGERLKEHDLGNGPSKLTQAMAIDKANTDKADLTKAEHIWLEDGDEIAEKNVVVTSRIGVSSAGEEWAQKPLRFYVQGSKGISVRDKKAELMLLEMSETK